MQNILKQMETLQEACWNN